MELNANEIKKALECCLSGDDCTICPLCDEQSCPCVLNENALSLITSQEERIKELEAEIAKRPPKLIITKLPKGKSEDV